MQYFDFIEKLSSRPSVSGTEYNISGFISGEFKKYSDRVLVDNFFNVTGVRTGKINKRKILVMAHCDEIGFMVKSIDENGFVKFTGIGGIDPKVLVAQEVIIYGRKEVFGVIGAKPPHLLKPEEMKKSVKLEEMSIDTGYSKEALEGIISIGDVITLKAGPVKLKGGLISGRALDNRLGVAALYGSMKEIHRFVPDNEVLFTASSQEEVGLRGAITAAYSIKPDIAIIIDACHGDMPDAPKDRYIPCGKGPGIGIGPNLHKKATRGMIELAKERNIPYQIDVEPGNSGTEAWATQVSGAGIPTILLSIPVRYMHTPVETANMEDLKNTVLLVKEFLSLSDGEVEGILCC